MFNLFLGQSRQKAIAVVKLWQNQTDSNAACSFVGDVWMDYSEIWYGEKKDLTMDETCCSMESSASKVTPRVFTTLENGMVASPTEKTVFLLDDGPQRSTLFFAHWVWVFFVIHIFIWQHHDSIFLNALSADSGSVGRHYRLWQEGYKRKWCWGIDFFLICKTILYSYNMHRNKG